MTRCDFDGVFHRVFCVTLLAIAFTFTVILTNVFIDIDGLLSTKEKGKTERIRIVPETNDAVVNREERIDRFQPPLFADDFSPYEEDTEEPAYRTKRSLDTSEFQFHIKNPKIKKVLTNQLATLLEELDAEESQPNKIEKPGTKKEVDVEERRSQNVEKTDAKDNSEMLHLVMHNILLQGIIGHMDLSEAYRKVHTVIKTMSQHVEDTKKEKDQAKPKIDDTSTEPTTVSPNSYNLENKFFDELVNCDELQQQIKDNNEQKIVAETRKSNKKKAGKMLIKTVIDITSLGSEKNKENNTNENIKGVIKLIYNGKSIKIKSMDDEDITKDIKNEDQVNETQQENQQNKNQEASESLTEQFGRTNIPKLILDNALDDYFKKYPNLSKRLENRRFNNRLKRNVKVRGETTTENTNAKKKKDDEELYVEIETHFDSKGIKGEKKKKLIRGLIDKIQKAIHVDIESFQDTEKKKRKHVHIKKRVQNPFDKAGHALENKIAMLSKRVEHRELNPILSKAVPVEETLPNMFDKSGEAWRKKFFGPNFLSSSKAINSGERGEVDLEYSKVIESNGIPQRLQQPLNAETDSLDNTIFDLGNLNFVIKELDGSGFSIGFNQYVGEPPDPESVRFFTGLNELVTKFQDKAETATEITEMAKHDHYDFSSEASHEHGHEHEHEHQREHEHEHDLRKRDVIRNKRHTNHISKTDKDYHSNEYRIIFNNNFMPYDSYQEIFEDRKKKVSVSVHKDAVSNESHHQNNKNIKHRTIDKPIEEQPIVIDDDFLSRDMRPSEILGIANLLNRKKRGLKVQKISKVKTKNNLRKYLPKTVKKIYIKKTSPRRNKRQIDKIRIVARDHSHRHSNEDMFVVSNENEFADRAVVREEQQESNNQPEDNFEYGSPYIYDGTNDYASTIFSDHSRHNALMSKYPHVFLEETSRKKDDTPEIPFFSQYLEKTSDIKREALDSKSSKRENLSKVEEDDIVEDQPKTDYKLTLKISPKNESTHPGFKEVHTSINKSISKNGLLYSSLVNVSEYSKIENVNNTGPSTLSPLVNHIKEQQEKMKYLLRQHRKKIDEQLDNLQKEKQNIDSMIVAKNVAKSSEMIDFILPSTPPKLVHLSKKEANELLASAFMKLHNTDNIDSTTQSTTTSTTPVTTTSIPTTIKTTTADPENNLIVTTMLRSENLTNIILNKLDKNTELLHTFLQKLINNTKNEQRHDHQPRIDHEDYREYIHDPFFVEAMPNMEVTKNDSHVSIPFVYAYQQPYPLSNKINNPVASVIYQGHIHTNALQRNFNQNNYKEITELKGKSNVNGRKELPLNQNIVMTNQTRFFIDNVNNDFKLMPVRNNLQLMPVKVNSTS